TADKTNGSFPDGVKASPLARKIAADKNIKLQAVTGSGPGGRIVKKDIEAYIASPPSSTAAPTASGLHQPTFPPMAIGQITPTPDQNVPLTRLRQAIGRRMSQSNQEFPSFFVTHEFNMDPIMAMRKQANSMLANGGEKLSVNDFIVKASALTLRKFPNLNAALQGDGVVQFGSINIGVAVSVPNGLLTVVSQNADQKPLRVISQEIKEKAGRVRSGKVHPDDISGSTFSVSNLGMYDVDSFVAIINPPEAAILAVGSAFKTPVVEGDEIKIGWRMKMTVTVDHRVSDGAEAAQFMQALAEYMENPLSMMLDFA
ncbi:MAG: 2-oxo acid dehydrogenase subunit E2, partial [Chloroflexota bacterium]